MSVAGVVGFVGVLVLVLQLVPDHEKRKVIIGSLSVVFAVLMYASPLSHDKKILPQRQIRVIFKILEGKILRELTSIPNFNHYISPK